MAKPKRDLVSPPPEMFPAGTVIFNAGDRGECMYVVQEGIVELLQGDRLIHTVGPGGMLGEMALINQAPRSLTARAKYDCELQVLNEKQFLSAVQTKPAFALEVMRNLAARLRSQTAS
jgi:CRP-like cAMP-binding protein